MSRQVNRSLKDVNMDHIDHALGRPVDPTAKTYRNYFTTSADSQIAKSFEASLYWKRGKAIPGDTICYVVTDEGRKALKQHLKDIGDKHRVFTVEYYGHETRVVAETAAKARYSYWLNISDCLGGMKFAEFCKSVTVRVAGGVRA